MTATLPPDDPRAKYESNPLHAKAKREAYDGKAADKCRPVEERPLEIGKPIDVNVIDVPIHKTIENIVKEHTDESDWHPMPKDVNTFSGREWFMVFVIVMLAASLVMLTWGVRDVA